MPTAQEIDAILPFLDRFEAATFAAGSWNMPEGQMPWFNFEDAVMEFHQALYDNGWVTPAFRLDRVAAISPGVRGFNGKDPRSRRRHDSEVVHNPSSCGSLLRRASGVDVRERAYPSAAAKAQNDS